METTGGTGRVDAVRGRLLSFTGVPEGEDAAVHADGMVQIGADGRIVRSGPAADVLPHLPPGAVVDEHPGRLITAGFIDTHIHAPQTQVIASYGTQLLDWLERYTFVEERKFASDAHAAANARFFLDELLRNGTTTAVFYGSVHPQSVDAVFAEAERRGVGLIGGKAMMDRNAPAALTDTAQSSYDGTKALIARWHGHGRQRCAVTPRFAITSTVAQLEAAGALLREHPDVHLQTHLAEHVDEIAAVRRLFPDDPSYTAVYARFGLLGPRSLFGHCIHLDDGEVRLLADTRSVAVHCPTSNLFMGSGLFDLHRLTGCGVRTALATDVGGGTSYSMLRTAAEAYKVAQLHGRNLPALAALRWMTLGNAEALGMAGEIGSLQPGRWADLVVLDSRATPAMAHRMATVGDRLDDEVFVLLTLGDDRAVAATYAQGRRVYARGESAVRRHADGC